MDSKKWRVRREKCEVLISHSNVHFPGIMLIFKAGKNAKFAVQHPIIFDVLVSPWTILKASKRKFAFSWEMKRHECTSEVGRVMLKWFELLFAVQGLPSSSVHSGNGTGHQHTFNETDEYLNAIYESRHRDNVPVHTVEKGEKNSNTRESCNGELRHPIFCPGSVCVCVCMYVCMCVCVCLCMCVSSSSRAPPMPGIHTLTFFSSYRAKTRKTKLVDWRAACAVFFLIIIQRQAPFNYPGNYSREW